MLAPKMMYTATLFLAVWSVFSLQSNALVSSRVLSAIKTATGEHVIVEGPHSRAIITATFNNTINITGWSFLEIRDLRPDTNRVATDEEIAELAGKLEANLTAELILMQWKNTMADYCATPSDYCNRLNSFIQNNTNFVNSLFDKELTMSPYLYQVSLWYKQLTGLAQGYSSSGLEKLPENAFLMLNIQGDLEDLESALGGDNLGFQQQQRRHILGSGSCSALIKVLPGNKELYVSHDTWEDFNTMLRIFKLYDFKYMDSNNGNDIIPGHRQVFSSYPGKIISNDDFYMLSSGLVAMETTIGNSNPDLWRYVKDSNLFEGIRSVVSNRLSTSGKEWASNFALYNMGTYNNQWMVVDYKLFKKGEKTLHKDLLWIIEQIPGTIKSEDQTGVLRKESYWPSFNIAYYSEIFSKSGCDELVRKYGPWFTWKGSPRAQIFKRDHHQVTDIDSMIKLMRYNDFKHDALSKCKCDPPYSGENAISARSDLNPSNGTYPFSALGHRRHGGTDNKVTSSELFASLSCMATSGPTFDQQPVFEWSGSGFKPIPQGHPDKWDFEPITVKWDN